MRYSAANGWTVAGWVAVVTVVVVAVVDNEHTGALAFQRYHPSPLSPPVAGRRAYDVSDFPRKRSVPYGRPSSLWTTTTTKTVLRTTTVEPEPVTAGEEKKTDVGEEDKETKAVAATVSVTAEPVPDVKDIPTELLRELEMEADLAVEEMLDETCEVDLETGGAVDVACVDAVERQGFRRRLKSVITQTLEQVRGYAVPASKDMEDEEEDKDGLSNLSEGELLERGWERRANSSALKRNAEVWKIALSAVFRCLRGRKLRGQGATEEEVQAAQVEAAQYIRQRLLELGPSFVKLGQVASTRTDVLPETFTDVLKTLTDDVPGFSGKRAQEIVSRELGKPCSDVFTDFSPEPIAAASLGQVHTAYYKGQKVAVKVQRAGLKELFDVDLKNLKKLAALLDKFDPKSDGADRDWVSIYEESERLLYQEIDYVNEADNTERFAADFADIEWVKIPRVYREVSTERILTMEYVDSVKLTNLDEIDRRGLDRKVLAKHVADAFLRQIIETAYFHADPHSGNLCLAADDSGRLVFYDFGMMGQLKPNVRRGFRTFCKALFAGGPKVSDLQLAKNAKLLVQGVEQAGVLSKSADRLAVEKLARYFMRTFKDKQLGKSGANIKETLGADLQTLTENNSFRFPSTFTFIFRAFASIEGIGKELDPDFDIGLLAQPFIEKFTDASKGYSSEAEKNLNIFRKATGLNIPDIETAVMQPRKVAYIEETLRAMETGNLKVRVRSLENEKALERVGLQQSVLQNLLAASLFLNGAGLAGRAVVRGLGVVGASFFLLQGLLASAKIKKFDKTQTKYESSSNFVEGGDEYDAAYDDRDL